MTMEKQRPIIIGHRGAAGEAPENTLGSFLLAVEQGSQAIELDVHMSADGRIMVCHDATLDRTTDRKGLIHQLRAEEIREADAGSWHSERYRGEKVPYLEEVFEALPANFMVNIEIKHGDERLGTAVLDLLRRTGRFGSTVVSCFDHKLLVSLKKQEPEVRIGLLYGAGLVDHAGYARLLGVDVYSLHPHHELIDAESVAEAVREGIAVYPYTANREDDLRRLIEWGVSGIITDYPARLKALLASK